MHNPNKEDTLLQSIDSVFHQNAKYLMFWDKTGILEGGLWVLLQHKAALGDGSPSNSENFVFRVLTDPEFGDMMLCILSGADSSSEPDPRSIVGFAIAAGQEPEDMGRYLMDYWSKIQHNMTKISGYRRSVYEYLIDKLQDSKLLCGKGLTMQSSGHVVS